MTAIEPHAFLHLQGPPYEHPLSITTDVDRPRVQLSDDLTATVRFDFGGFGIGSDQTVSLVGGLQHRISPNATLGAGWRILDVDYDRSGFVFDAKLSGPIVGLTFTF